jgi:hypothetical protein
VGFMRCALKKSKSASAVDNSARSLSMPKVPDTREDHGDAMLIAGRNGVLIADGTAGLSDGLDAQRRGQVDIISKREKRVRRHH